MNEQGRASSQLKTPGLFFHSFERGFFFVASGDRHPRTHFAGVERSHLLRDRRPDLRGDCLSNPAIGPGSQSYFSRHSGRLAATRQPNVGDSLTVFWAFCRPGWYHTLASK